MRSLWRGIGNQLRRDCFHIGDRGNCTVGFTTMPVFFLFIFDDVWCFNGIKQDFLQQLPTLVSNSEKDGDIHIVYSTQDDSLTCLGDIIQFEPKDLRGTTAKNILLRCAMTGSDVVEDPKCARAISKILDMCAGPPVALRNEGRDVRWQRNK